MSLTVNSFFCGAGGFDLGFIQAGFDVKAAWDFDKYAVQSYEHNIGDHVQQRDIKEMTGDEIPEATGWLFGFPCQDLSIANINGKGLEGERSGLFFEVMRLLGEVREKPVFILAENVKALKKHLPTLEEEYKKAGYRMYFTLYNSKYHGVPQNRERYFCFGVREDVKTDFIFPEQKTDYIPKIKKILENRVEENFYLSDERAKTIIEKAVNKMGVDLDKTIVKGDILTRENPQRQHGFSQQLCFTLRNAVQHGVILDDTYGFGGIRVYTGATPTLRSQRIGIKVIGNLDVDWNNERMKRVFDAEGIAPTIGADTDGWTQIKILSETLRVRKLTPREYARLQGFPDDYEQIVSNTQFYKQMGNAVTVPVAKHIGQAIKRFLEGENND